MTCATCKNWQPRNSGAMAAHRMCPCALGPAWRYLPPSGTCRRQAAVEPAVAEQRIEWIGKHGPKNLPSTVN